MERKLHTRRRRSMKLIKSNETCFLLSNPSHEINHQSTPCFVFNKFNMPLFPPFQGTYNHGNDIKELANAATTPPQTIATISFAAEDKNRGNGLVSSCSSISGSSSSTDPANYTSSVSGQSSTTNILNASSNTSPWSKMQQRCTWQYAVDLFILLAGK